MPPVPESLEELAIPPAIIEQLVLKYLYFRGELIGREIGTLLGLPFSLIDDLLETMKRQHYIGEFGKLRQETTGQGRNR